MKFLITALIAFSLTMALRAQEAEPPVLKRTQAPQAKPAVKTVSLPVKTIPEAVLRVPPVLDKSVVEAIRLGESVRSEPAVPAKGTYGSLVYTYGRGEPVLVCAPLRVCFLELQPGEKIQGEPVAGDTVGWLVAPGLYGGEDESTQTVIIRPLAADIETNLLVHTDRRIYAIRLVSRAEDYVARVAFRYPEDDSKAWALKVAKSLPPPAPVAPPEPKILPAIVSAERLDFGYRITGGDAYTRPLKVFNDESKTFMVMPSAMQHREAPVLLVIGDDGKPAMSNYRVVNNTYVLDKLADRMHLVVGHGKKARKVEITRENRS